MSPSPPDPTGSTAASSAALTDQSRAAHSGSWFGGGAAWALLGVLAFSVTLPMTVLAIRGFDPTVVGTGRSVGAGLIAAVALAVARVSFPPRELWRSFILIALGVGIGFGFLTSLALRTESAAHGAVVIAMMPAATAIVATVRGGERPGKTFWLASAVGTVVVLGYVLARSGFTGISAADGLFLLATLCAAVGYAEGGALARTMPGWQVIAWGMVFTLPIAIPATAIAVAVSAPAHPTPASLIGFAYLVLISMFVGFVAWYRGMGMIGVARASQVQLVQPLLTVGWAALLLGEVVGIGTLTTAVAVVACVAVTQRARIGAVSPVP